MSLHERIQELEGEGALVALRPRAFRAPIRRALFVSAELDERLRGPWQSSAEEERWVRLEADLAMFVEGALIVVPDYMKRLHPSQDEVWEILSRKPRPSIRVFGRFAEADVFVALTWAERRALGGLGDRAWRDAILACKTAWKKLFLTYEPLRGETLDAYITDDAVRRAP